MSFSHDKFWFLVGGLGCSALNIVMILINHVHLLMK